MLRVIEDYEPERNLSGPQTGSLELLSQSCHEVLDKLRDSLEKYSHVVSVDRSAKGSIQRAWKKITWDSKEAMYFHEKIESQINHFSLFLAESTLYVLDSTMSKKARSNKHQPGGSRNQKHGGFLYKWSKQDTRGWGW